MNMKSPGNMMKLMSAYGTFTKNHPKFSAFLNAVVSRGVDEGAVIEVTITNPGEVPMTTNMIVQASDLELLEELKSLGK